MTTPKIPSALVPLYTTTEPNDPIRLYEGPMSATDAAGRSVTGDGIVDWSWLPFSTPSFVCRYPGTMTLSSTMTHRLTITLNNLGITATGLLSRLSVMGETHELRGIFSGSLETAPTLPIKKLIFHVPNYHALYGTGITYHDRDVSYCRLQLDTTDWRITLDAVEGWRLAGTNTLTSRTSAQSGNAISHVGLLTKTNDAPFTLDEAREILECFRLFLSFSLGRWTAPILWAGIDTQGDRVSLDWASGRIDPCIYRRSWPALSTPQQQNLPQVWLGFVKLWRQWGPAFSVCLEWYLQANSTSVSATGVILGQTALELLFWQIIAEPVLLKQVSEHLRFSDTLRLLLNACGISSIIPPTLTNLIVEARKNNNNWVDGPHALNASRNALVHASKLHAALGINLSAMEEVRQLALWYTEIVLLRQMGYIGQITSRINNNSVTAMS